MPRRVVQVKSFPREGTGKLTVRALREFALAQLAEDDTPVQMALAKCRPDHPVFAGPFPGAAAAAGRA